MEEKKDQERNEEMSLEDLQETSGGKKGHCGFTNEAGHCGYTCESDGSFDLSVKGVRIHCPNCWSRKVNYPDIKIFFETKDGYTFYEDNCKFTAICVECGNTWDSYTH